MGFGLEIWSNKRTGFGLQSSGWVWISDLIREPIADFSLLWKFGPLIESGSGLVLKFHNSIPHVHPKSHFAFLILIYIKKIAIILIFVFHNKFNIPFILKLLIYSIKWMNAKYSNVWLTFFDLSKVRWEQPQRAYSPTHQVYSNV